MNQETTLEERILSNHNLSASSKDGIASAVALGAGESFIGAFAVYLKATTFQLGFLGALPPLLGAAAHCLGVYLMEKVKSRRGLTTLMISLQSSLWLSFVFFPFIFSTPQSAATALIFFYSLYHIIGGIVAPIWSSLIGDLVPEDIRGEYFGYRNSANTASAMTALVIGGLLLNACEYWSDTAYGFALVFMMAFFARSLASYWISCHDDPGHSFSKSERLSLKAFISALRESNFGKYVIFRTAFHFALFIASPFYPAYLIGAVGLSYFHFSVLIVCSMAAQLFTFRRWGSISDTHGNKRILEWCTWGHCAIPLLWLISSNYFYLILLHILGGLLHAGFSLALGNFVFDSLEPEKRGRMVAYKALLTGIAIFSGSMLGSGIASLSDWICKLQTITDGIQSGFLTAFLASGLVRLLIAKKVLGSFSEVRTVAPISSRKILFRIASIRIDGTVLLRPIRQFAKLTGDGK